jgi:hypothetical protein
MIEMTWAIERDAQGRRQLQATWQTRVTPQSLPLAS